MAVKLLRAARIAGTEVAEGTVLYRTAAQEAEFVSAGLAQFVSRWPNPPVRGIAGGDGFSYQPWRASNAPVALRYASDLTNWALGNSGTAATATVDADSPFGVPAIRLDIPNGNTYAQLTCAGLTVPGFNSAAGQVAWIVYIENQDIISQAQSIIGDSGFAQNATLTYNLGNSDTHNKNGLHVISHATTLAYAVTDLRLRVFGGSVPSGSVGRVWLLGVVIPRPTKPFVVITFDDADVSWHTRALPELRARGLHATFAINTGQVGTNDGLYVNDAKLHEIYAAGNDIGNHNVTNTSLVTAGLSGYLSEFDQCAAYLKSRGWERGARYHPFVQGKHSPAAISALHGRGVTVMRSANASENVVRESIHFGPPLLVARKTSLDNGTNLATAQGHIDTAITYSHDVFLMGHILAAAAASVTWAQADFASLLDYAQRKVQAGELEGIGSVSEWAALRGVPFWD